MDMITLAAAKSYTKKTLDGIGSLQGKDGKSAYQIWLDNDNKGTEQDFLNSLKGAKGDRAIQVLLVQKEILEPRVLLVQKEIRVIQVRMVQKEILVK